MAVEVLGRRVHDEVRAERERLLPDGGQEGVVDYDERTGRVAERHEMLDVGDPQQRIARRLDPEERRGPGERGFDGRKIAEVDELDTPLATTPPGFEQPVGAAVAVVGRDDAGAG